jgi:hypothetical protein
MELRPLPTTRMNRMLIMSSSDTLVERSVTLVLLSLKSILPDIPKEVSRAFGTRDQRIHTDTYTFQALPLGC